MRCKAFSCCGAQRMSSVLKPLRPSLSVCGTRQKLRLSKQARFLPTTAHTALALDSATGSGQVRVHCHSFGSLLPPPAALPSFPGISPAVRFRATYKKAGAQKGVCFFGAGNRNRTGTDFTPRDFLTTIAFATRLVCGLDHAFTCSRWSVSGLYTFQGYPWLGSALPLSKVSPNLLTFRIVIPGYLLYSLTDSSFVTNGNWGSRAANC